MKDKPCMEFNLTVMSTEYDELSQSKEGSLYAYRFPWGFSIGCIFKIAKLECTEKINLVVVGSYQNLVYNDSYSIELKKC